MATENSNPTKSLTILAYGNPNSGKEDILKSLSQPNPLTTDFIIPSSSKSHTPIIHFSSPNLAGSLIDSSSLPDAAPTSPTVILFISNIADYDQFPSTDPTLNHLQADINFFSTIANSPPLKQTPIILFLTHFDEFGEKVERVKLQNYFEDAGNSLLGIWSGDWVLGKFLENNSKEDRKVYAHFVKGGDEVSFFVKALEDVVGEEEEWTVV